MIEWLSVREAAEHLGLARSAVYSLVASGKLARYRIGPNAGRIRFKASDLDAYVESCREGPKEKVATAPTSRHQEYIPKYDHSKPGRPLRKP